MSFSCQLTNASLLTDLGAFARENSFPDLYRPYSWKNDTYLKGFPDIYSLETRLSLSDQTTGITLDDVKAVAAWGSMRNQKRIRGPAVISPANTLHSITGETHPTLANQPLVPLSTMQAKLHGVGPTYVSKVLRFALPQEYGAIDTRCVRVFGHGDSGANQHHWIQLRARNDGYGWYIPGTQARWPHDYAVWLNILRHCATLLPKNCSHPQAFVQAGLRRCAVWECADVEMALFSYVSRFT
jgi:hypothetical protein